MSDKLPVGRIVPLSNLNVLSSSNADLEIISSILYSTKIKKLLVALERIQRLAENSDDETLIAIKHVARNALGQSES